MTFQEVASMIESIGFGAAGILRRLLFWPVKTILETVLYTERNVQNAS